MSYGVVFKCLECKKNDKCVDSTVIKHSVYALHDLTSIKGHLGHGNVIIDCHGFEPKE